MTDKTSVLYTITTLGQFDVVKNNDSLVMSASSSKKLWELYKFLLVHRSQKFTPETLADQLWVSESYSDHRGTLRRQMHRLRQILKEEPVDENEWTILFASGYYMWNSSVSIKVDSDIFEAEVASGDLYMQRDSNEALRHYLMAIALYKGDYLPDLLNQHWVFSVRNHYRRLYLRAVENAVKLLMHKHAFDEIVRICQAAIRIDVHEEMFHIHYMKALAAKGLLKDALLHYEQITGFYFREMGLKPSKEMRELYNVLTTEPVSAPSAIKDHVDNAHYCEPDVFKSISELEHKRVERSGADYCVGYLTIDEFSEPVMQRMKNHLFGHLRKGDCFTRWNERQFAVLFYGANRDQMTMIFDRLLGNFGEGDAFRAEGSLEGQGEAGKPGSAGNAGSSGKA
jgi:DNA-binding SARP family transcriptional activator